MKLKTQDIVFISILVIILIITIIASLRNSCSEKFNNPVYGISPPINKKYFYIDHTEKIKQLVEENQGKVDQPCQSDSDCGNLQTCALAAGNEKVGPTCIYNIVNYCTDSGVC